MNGSRFQRFERLLGRRVPACIELDFVAIRARPGVLGWGLLAVGLLGVGGEAARYIDARTDLFARAQHLHELRRRQAVEAPRVAAEPPLTVQEVQGAQRVAARLEADWSEVFASLARVRGADVAWVEVEMLEAQAPASRAPQGAGEAGAATAMTRGLRLTGEARSLDAVLAVLDRMRGEPVLGGIELVSHEAAAQGGASFVRFVIASRNRGRT